ncbi:MAG: TetR/AcrR family transcriptional regulator [Acidimicrobiales bacterium]
MSTSGAPSSRTRWAGVPAADRRTGRRALLLDAALELLGTEGWSGTTVRAICHAARLNPRYFYESFHDLDALVVALYDQLIAELRAEVEAALAHAPDAPAMVRATVESTVRFVDQDRRRGRVLYGEALGNEALNRRRIEAGFAVADLIAAQADGEVHQLSAIIVVGGFSELLMAWLDGRIKVGRTQLIDDATQMFIALGEAAARIAAVDRGRPLARARRGR